MFSRHNRVMGLLYLAADALGALLSFALAYWARSYRFTPRPLYELSNYLWIIPLAVGLWIGVGIVAGIYREIHEEELRRAFSDPIKVALIATTLLFASITALKLEYISRLLMGFYAAFDLVIMIRAFHRSERRPRHAPVCSNPDGFGGRAPGAHGLIRSRRNGPRGPSP